MGESSVNKVRQEEVEFMDDINEIIEENFWLLPKDRTSITLSTNHEDTKESFDMVYNSRVEVSVRIRKYEYLKYCDLTIRRKSYAGERCEFDKLVDGKGSIYLYAWKDKPSTHIHTWVLVDIDKIRPYLKENNKIIFNSDGTGFTPYKLNWVYNKGGLISCFNIPDNIRFETNG